MIAESIVDASAGARELRSCLFVCLFACLGRPRGRALTHRNRTRSGAHTRDNT
jgi:hypothetical protein